MDCENQKTNAELYKENEVLRKRIEKNQENRDYYWYMTLVLLGVTALSVACYLAYVFGLAYFLGGVAYPRLAFVSDIYELLFLVLVTPILIPAAFLVATVVVGIIAATYTLLALDDTNTLNKNLEQIEVNEMETLEEDSPSPLYQLGKGAELSSQSTSSSNAFCKGSSFFKRLHQSVDVPDHFVVENENTFLSKS